MASRIDKTVKREVNKTAEKVVKNNTVCVIVAIVLLIIFAIVGVITAFIITKNDGFTLVNSNKSISLSIGEEYKEEGGKFVVFGKDVSNLVKTTIYDDNGNIVTEIKSEVTTTYSVVYSVNTDLSLSNLGGIDKFFVGLFIGKYKNFQLVRTVTISS